VTAAQLRRFVAKTASREEKEAVLRHLLAGCATCQQCLRREGWDSGGMEAGAAGTTAFPPPVPRGAYDAAFAAAQRSVEEALRRRHLPAQRLLAELDPLPPEQQELKVRNLRRYASPALAEAYVDRSHEVRFRDAKEMLRYARLAVTAAEAATRLDAGGDARLHDCRARAWGQLGTANRVNAQLIEAGRELGKAVDYVEAGTGDKSLRVWLWLRRAAYERFARKYKEAVPLLEEAARLSREVNDRALEAAALSSLGAVHLDSGHPERAERPLQRAVQLAEFAQDGNLSRTANQALIWCYLYLGRPVEAYELLAVAELHFRHWTDELGVLRVEWLKGCIERGIGLHVAAEVRLGRVRDEFARKGLSFEVGVLSLELAQVYACTKQVPQLLGMVAEALPIFQGLGVEQDFLAALLQVREVADTALAFSSLKRLLERVRSGFAPHQAQAAD
jgi:tetratricopeptide (TPR) repeat protein